MKAAELIAQVDALRPNHYSIEQKLAWLCRLDGQIWQELILSHEGEGQEPAAEYGEDTELLAPAPYDSELYSAYLFCQIDLNNAEIQKYNQSAAMMSAAWRQLADWYNRGNMPKGKGRFRF